MLVVPIERIKRIKRTKKLKELKDMTRGLLLYPDRTTFELQKGNMR